MVGMSDGMLDPRVDAKSLELLEFDRVLQKVAAWAATRRGRQGVLALRPATSLVDALQRQEQVTQVRRLLEAGGESAQVPLQVGDVDALVLRARAGGRLTGQELVQLAATAEELTRLERYLRRWAAGEGALAPALAPLAGRMADFTALARRLREALEADGSVRDAASPHLAAIRARLRRAHERVQEALQSLIQSPAGRRALQEPIITLRGGRYVVPVRQEHRDQVPGIVHDASASGATLFVEPFSVVEANNAVRTEQAREAAEVERILLELTGRVAERSGELQGALQAAAELDVLVAMARYAMEAGAIRPGLNDQGRVRLPAARHPLLTGRVVPVDLEVGDAFSVLVITGPNMGGKTVALKAVGLLCAMAACGMHLPAGPGCEVAVFREIWVDLGDPQSLPDNLSSFAGHLLRIRPILSRAEPSTLVLLDELGSGTDPEEGAALAWAILDHLRRRGARVVATTHLGALKVMAHQVPGMANASVGFDVDRLEPTYRLVMGSPGPSHGLALAERLGLPAEVVAAARERLGHGQLALDAVVQELQRALDEARTHRQEAARARQEAERLREQALQAWEEARTRRARAAEQAREQAAGLLRELRTEVEALRARAREAAAKASREELARVRAEVHSLWRQSDRRLTAVEDVPEHGGDLATDDVEAPSAAGVPGGRVGGPLAPRTPVWVVPLGCYGTVESPADEGWVWVRVGALRTRVAEGDLRAVTLAAGPQAAGVESAPRTVPARPAAGEGVRRAASVSPEVDLRGMTAEEALLRLDKYLDDCLLAGTSRVRVIHGHGTGALRQAVRKYLQDAPSVKRFGPAPAEEGGNGATVVELA